MVSLLIKTFLTCILSISYLNQAMQEAESDPTQELLAAMNSGTEDDAEKAMSAVARGANVNVFNEESNTALFYAMRINHLPLAELLITMKAALERPELGYRSTILTVAGNQQKYVFVKLFLAAGAQVGYLLHVASETNHIQLMEILLEHKADVDIQDLDGYTPLHHASEPSVAKLLLERGADWQIKNNQGYRPTDLDCFATDPRMHRLIEERKKGIRKQFEISATTIIHAMPLGQEEGIAKIIAEYAVPDLEDCNMALKRSIDKFNQRV